MINFIIHEINQNLKNQYEMVIYNFLGQRNEKFNVFNYNKKEELLHNRNIYIISSKSITKIHKIAKEIRLNDNWINPIIVITNKNNLNNSLLDNKYLILSYIENNKYLNENLKEAIFNACVILNNDLSLSFNSYGEVFKIPYNDILYIEKNNNQNYCVIVTTKGTCHIKETINNLENILDSNCFIKTHRSCIVNISNIKNYKLSTNVITFNNNLTIDLISRDKKWILKEKLIKNQIIE